MILPTGCLGSSPLEMGRCRRDWEVEETVFRMKRVNHCLLDRNLIQVEPAMLHVCILRGWLSIDAKTYAWGPQTDRRRTKSGRALILHEPITPYLDLRWLGCICLRSLLLDNFAQMIPRLQSCFQHCFDQIWGDGRWTTFKGGKYLISERSLCLDSAHVLCLKRDQAGQRWSWVLRPDHALLELQSSSSRDDLKS